MDASCDSTQQLTGCDQCLAQAVDETWCGFLDAMDVLVSDLMSCDGADVGRVESAIAAHLADDIEEVPGADAATAKAIAERIAAHIRCSWECDYEV